MKMTHLSHLPNMNIIGEVGDRFGKTSLTSHVTCHVSLRLFLLLLFLIFMLNFFFKDKLVNKTRQVGKLVSEGSVFQRGYPV